MQFFFLYPQHYKCQNKCQIGISSGFCIACLDVNRWNETLVKCLGLVHVGVPCIGGYSILEACDQYSTPQTQIEHGSSIIQVICLYILVPHNFQVSN